MTAQVPPGWDSIAAEYDEVVTPLAMSFAEELLDRVEVGPGVQFLDVAAGSGALAIPAARRGADLVATDIAAGLIERLRARAQAEGLTKLDARAMDAQSLELEDDTFDISASQFGINLVPDLARGFGELARVTKPGGRVLIASFGPAPKVEFMGFFFGALKATVPGFTPPDLSDAPPTRLSDPEVFRAVLTDAGLTGVEVETTTWRWDVRSGSHLWDVVLSSNPMGNAMVANLTDEQRTEVKAVLDGMLRERSNGNGGTINVAVNVGVATK